MNKIKEQHKNQPLFVVLDDAYERMWEALTTKGEPFVKTYIGVCPHKSEKKCKCEFFKNILHDDMIMREVDGVMKPVVSVSLLEGSLNRLGIPKNGS